MVGEAFSREIVATSVAVKIIEGEAFSYETVSYFCCCWENASSLRIYLLILSTICSARWKIDSGAEPSALLLTIT